MLMRHLSAGALLVLASPAIGAEAEVKMQRDCEGCPEMITVEPGSFLMGATVEEEARHGMAAVSRGKPSPLRTVTFKASFSMSRDLVTVAQFRAFVEETGYNAPNSCYTQYENDGHFIYENARGFSWRSPGFPQTEDHPVVCLSWHDAVAYAKWLSAKTGRSYALPNEAQFEYAARAGTKTSYYWGDEPNADACLYTNGPDFAQADAMGDVPRGPEYRFQCSDGHAYTSPVGTYRPNAWGFRDMLGNVWEYTLDCWNDNYRGAPTDGSTWRTGDCDAHPSRGGSYGNAVHATYVAARTARNADYNGHSWGFRVVRND